MSVAIDLAAHMAAKAAVKDEEEKKLNHAFVQKIVRKLSEHLDKLMEKYGPKKGYRSKGNEFGSIVVSVFGIWILRIYLVCLKTTGRQEMARQEVKNLLKTLTDSLAGPMDDMDRLHKEGKLGDVS